MRVLITGARGLLGAAIVREFHDADVHAFDHDQLDVADEAAVTDAVGTTRPDVVINCAAYNDVEKRAGWKPRSAPVNDRLFRFLRSSVPPRRTGAVVVPLLRLRHFVFGRRD